MASSFTVEAATKTASSWLSSTRRDSPCIRKTACCAKKASLPHTHVQHSFSLSSTHIGECERDLCVYICASVQFNCNDCDEPGWLMAPAVPVAIAFLCRSPFLNWIVSVAASAPFLLVNTFCVSTEKILWRNLLSTSLRYRLKTMLERWGGSLLTSKWCSLSVAGVFEVVVVVVVVVMVVVVVVAVAVVV